MLRGMSADGLLGLDLRYRRSRHEYLACTQEKLNKVNAEFDKIADECYQRARQIVQANAELIKKLMPVLVDRGNLFKKECENVLTELGGIKAVKQGGVCAFFSTTLPSLVRIARAYNSALNKRVQPRGFNARLPTRNGHIITPTILNSFNLKIE